MPVTNPFDPLYNFPDINVDDLIAAGAGGGSTGGSNPPPSGSDPVTGGTVPTDTNLRDQLGIPAWAWAIQPTYLWSFEPGTGLWTNPHTRKQYNASGQEVGAIPDDPKHPENNIPFPGADGADQGGYVGDATPDDGPTGPSTGGATPGGLPPIRAQISPNWDPASGNWIGLPPPTGSSGGSGGGNPMPGRPMPGLAPVSPHLFASRNNGTPAGQREAFKPWGEELGFLSQALRYGGTPTLHETGGFTGNDGYQAMLAAALRGEG